MNTKKQLTLKKKTLFVFAGSKQNKVKKTTDPTTVTATTISSILIVQN